MVSEDVLAAMDAEATYLETIGNPRGAHVRDELERLTAGEPVAVSPGDNDDAPAGAVDADAIDADDVDADDVGPVKPEKAVKPPTSRRGR